MEWVLEVFIEETMLEVEASGKETPADFRSNQVIVVGK